MHLQISPTMSLDQLVEWMYVDGDQPNNATQVAAIMRDLLWQFHCNNDAGAYTTNDVEDADRLRMLNLADAAASCQATIVGQFSALNNTETGIEARLEYARAIERQQPDAEIIGSNVLQRAGYQVNQRGGASFEMRA